MIDPRQKKMCFDAIHQAAVNRMQDFVNAMEKERSRLYSAWIKGGKTDALWAEVAAYDVELDGQQAVLNDLRAGPSN